MSSNTLDHYLSNWTLSSPEKLASTFTSDVYKVHDQDGKICVLKILNDVGQKFEAHSIPYLSFMNGNGTIELYRYDDNALLLEYAGNTELRTLVDAGQDDQATEIAANVIKTLHDNQSDIFPDGIWTMERNAKTLFDADNNLHPLVETAKQLFQKLIDTQNGEDIRMLHRDIHHMNILKSDRGWLAIDPQPVIGDRYYECTMFFLNPEGYSGLMDVNRVRNIEEIFCDILDLNCERLRQFVFAHAMLSGCWCISDGQDPARAFQLAELIHDKLI